VLIDITKPKIEMIVLPNLDFNCVAKFIMLLKIKQVRDWNGLKVKAIIKKLYGKHIIDKS